MPSSAETLLDLLDEAREADRATRIEWRDPIAAHGVAAIQAVRPWLGDPSLVFFAIRTIEKAASTDPAARQLAVEALRAVRGEAFVEPARRDAEEALRRLGAPTRQARSQSTAPKAVEPIPALVRGHLYRRRDLREAGLLGNTQSGISYPAGGGHACLFSGGANGEAYGYRDRPAGDRRYLYYGEWRGTRDMSLTGGNLAIVQRSPNLYLFVADHDSFHRFEGRFVVIDHERVIAERDGVVGEAIVFTIERVADDVRL